MDLSGRRNIRSEILFICALASIFAIGLLFIYNIVRWGNIPDYGFGYRTAAGFSVVGVVTGPGSSAGMEIGDWVIKVNNKSFNNMQEFRAAQSSKLGEKNTYIIERAGQQFEVTITNTPLRFKGAFFRSGLTYTIGLCYVMIGILVFLMKPHYRNSWFFFIFTAVVGLFFVFFVKLAGMKPHWLGTLHILINSLLPAVFVQLGIAFPTERAVLKNHPWIQFLPFFASILLFALLRSSAPVLADVTKVRYFFLIGYIAVSITFFLGSCLQLWLTSKSEIVRLRSKMILIGAGISALVPLFEITINALFRMHIFPSFNYYLPFLIVFPLAIGYSIVKHDLFDIDAIIKRTYGYILTTGTIAGIYGIVVLVSNLAFGGFDFAKSHIFSLVFILAIVFLFNPIRNRVQKFIDRVFYRLEYDYQETVQKISETMRTLLGLDEVSKSIMNVALGTMFIDSGAVLLRRRDEDKYNFLIRAGKKDEALTNSRIQEIASHSDVIHKTDKAAEETTFEKKETTKDGNYTEPALPADQPLIQKISDQKKAVTIYDIQEAPFFEDARESCQKVFEQLDATLIVPLIYEDRLTGLISLGRKKSGKFYRREDINLLNILANQGAVAIENAQMVQEVIEKERMEEELSIARDLQVSMLPAECPKVEGFEIAALSVSAMEVGGDFYDFIDMGEDKKGMVIGDVTGKSVSGALVMSASRSVFRMLSEEVLSVGESMIRANRRLKKDVKPGMFVALLYTVFNAHDRTLTMCSAGQTQPVLMSAKSGLASLVETKGDTFPLGILDEADYEETLLQLETGDKVVFYTDGIVEAMNEQEEMFGFERLLKMVQTSQSAIAEELLNEIVNKVKEFTGSAPQHDDLTIIVISVE